MTRGNQRDRDRERAQARGTAKGKGKDDGLTPEQRRERDGKALQEKAAKKAAEGAGSGNSEGKSTKKYQNWKHILLWVCFKFFIFCLMRMVFGRL
ncbi:hypothetical protein LOK49_LG06G02409 [Camellia lanceoleosa]|uniref:Uncharacterized protein n=1 Tax=Camellia lanceoleosa TaxID=1840588 RepID=A0ACC0HCN3_9ERIC|nr:hypothetical protein LOK49_LG06G02409 [Camellia lanceoleosa]